MIVLAVLDTNILVSALWSQNGAPARVVSAMLAGSLVPCYDHRIMTEYREVLLRPKFKFTAGEVNALLGWIVFRGRCVAAEPLPVAFADEGDRKFYEVAKYCQAILITGNMKHFPADRSIMTVADFLEQNGWQ